MAKCQCGKSIGEKRVTCSALCRKRKEQATAWLAGIAKQEQYAEFTSQELAMLGQFAGQHG
jgi:hypothetical protein